MRIRGEGRKGLLRAVLGMALVATGTAFGEETEVASLLRTGDVYLEGTGQSHIDTGCTIGPKTRVVMDYSYGGLAESGSYTYYIWGVSDDATRSEFAYVQTDDVHVRVRNQSSTEVRWGGTSTPGQNVRLRMDYDLPGKKMQTYVGHCSSRYAAWDLNAGTATSTGTISIFGWPVGTGWWGWLPRLRVYSFQIYEAGTLVRDFVPYGHGALTGLVDRCTGKVYTDQPHSSGAAKLKIGHDVGSAASVQDTYLDTGYRLNAKTKLEVTFANDDNLANRRILGAEGGAGAWFSLFGDGNARLVRGYGDGQTVTNAFTADSSCSALGPTYTYTLDLPGNAESLVRGTKQIYSGALLASVTQEAAVPLAAYCLAELGSDGTTITPKNFSRARIFSLRIWEDGALVRDYVPRVTDNVAGLYDRVNKTFLTATIGVRRKAELEWSGEVEATNANGASIAANGDACLVSHATEIMNTGYCFTPKSRVEVDYAWWGFTGTRYILGGGLGENPYVGVYGQAYDNTDFVQCFYAGKWGGEGGGGSTAIDGKRMRCVVDVTKKKIYIYEGLSTTCKQQTGILSSTASKTSVVPMALFGQGQSQSGSMVYTDPSYLKVYSLKIYEDDALVHDYVPARRETQNGLYDCLTGTFLTKATGTRDFELRGGGRAGQGLCFEQQPASAEVAIGETVTLKAFAPGAAAYHWFRNGVSIAGGAAGELTVAWRKGASRADVYTCVAEFALWGYAESAPATLTFARRGSTLLLK